MFLVGMWPIVARPFKFRLFLRDSAFVVAVISSSSATYIGDTGSCPVRAAILPFEGGASAYGPVV